MPNESRIGLMESVVTIALALAASQPAFGASFDCSLAREPDEIRICNNTELSQLDETMAGLYLDLLGVYAGEDFLRSHLTSGQREWLKERAKCADDACLKASFEARIDHLKTAKQSFDESAAMPPLSPEDLADAQAEVESDYEEEQEALAGVSDDPLPAAAPDPSGTEADGPVAAPQVAPTEAMPPPVIAQAEPSAPEAATDRSTAARYLPVWVTVAAALGGATIAGLLVGLLMWRKRRTSAATAQSTEATILTSRQSQGPATQAQKARTIAAKFETLGAMPAKVADPMAAVMQAFAALQWTVKERTGDVVIGSLGTSLESFGETITVTVNPDRSVLVRSQSRGMQLVDWGKNKTNVFRFLSALENVTLASVAPETAKSPLAEPAAVAQAANEPTAAPAQVAQGNVTGAHLAAVERKQRIWTGIGLAVLLCAFAFKGWAWLQKSAGHWSKSEPTALTVAEPSAPPLELPLRLSCAPNPISRWEDGAMFYDLGVTPLAMIAVPGTQKIFSGTFTRTSQKSGTFSTRGVLDVSTNRLTPADDVVRLEVVAVDSNGVYTLKNTIGTQYCVSDSTDSTAAQATTPQVETSREPEDTSVSAEENASFGDKAAIGYIEKLPWVHQGTCEMLYRTARRMVGTGLPYEIQIRQVDSVVNKAIDVGCIAE